MTATISRPKISNWETSNIPNLTGKTALITGANSGLGYYTAKALAEKNAHVVIACRSLEKANQTIKKLKGLNPSGIFTPLELDLSDLKNIVEIQSKIFNNFENLEAGILLLPVAKVIGIPKLCILSNILEISMLTSPLVKMVPSRSVTNIGEFVNV